MGHPLLSTFSQTTQRAQSRRGGLQIDIQNFTIIPGGYIDGRGGPTLAHETHVFMVTNLCPAVAPNLDWCAQPKAPWDKGVNTFEYAYHFDLQNARGQMSSISWNNPEVTVEEVPCTEELARVWKQCQCHVKAEE